MRENFQNMIFLGCIETIFFTTKNPFHERQTRAMEGYIEAPLMLNIQQQLQS